MLLTSSNNMGDKFGVKFSKLIYNFTCEILQCFHCNFSHSAKVASRFEIVTDHECNLTAMILIIANQMVCV